MAQQQGFAATLLYDNDAIIDRSSIGFHASAGSASGGTSGRTALGRDVTLLGGLSYGSEGYRSARIEDVFLIAAKLRFLPQIGSNTHLLFEAGGFWSPSGTYRFHRSYVNGAGTASGSGQANGDQTYFFGRAGVVFSPDAADELALSGELGRQTLSANGYDEALTTANPFEAHVAPASERLTIAKLRSQWTHRFNHTVDATVWAAGVRGFNDRTSLAVGVPGFGMLRPLQQSFEWAEYGGRIGYNLNERLALDVFANGVSGDRATGTRMHFGGAVKLMF